MVAVVVLAALSLALAKPWGGAPATGPVPSPPPNAAGATIRVSVVPIASIAAWPAQATTLPQSVSAATIAGAAELLVRRAGAWGVGAGGSGPRLSNDQIWADWVAVTPRPVASQPEFATPNARPLCAGVPTLVDRPSVIAVTAPAGLAPAAWQLVGWWTDGGPLTSLTSSLRPVATPGAAGVTVLGRADQAIWPSGRYEFQLSAGRSIVALAVCLDAGP